MGENEDSAPKVVLVIAVESDRESKNLCGICHSLGKGEGETQMIVYLSMTTLDRYGGTPCDSCQQHVGDVAMRLARGVVTSAAAPQPPRPAGSGTG